MTALNNIGKSGLTDAFGAELIVNGSFDDGEDGWTVGAEWDLGDGLAVHNPGEDEILQSSSFNVEAGKTYRITVIFDNVAAGGVSVQLDTAEHEFSSAGTYTFDYTATEDAESTVGIFPVSEFDGAIASLSVREVRSPYPKLATVAKS